MTRVKNLAVILLADRAHGDAARRLVEFHLRHRRHHVGELRTRERAVQHRHVVGIGHVLEMLEPVAGDDRRTTAADRGIVGFDELAVIHGLQAFVSRQHRAFLGRAHIGEDQPVALLDRIPGLAHIVLVLAAVRLAGLLQAVTFGVELPAVIAAADAVLLDLAVVERGAAMAAARVQQADAAVLVAEQHQIFAEGTHLLRRVGGITDKSDRMPVAAEQFAHRRAAHDRGELGTCERRLHRIGGAEIAIPLGDGHADPPAVGRAGPAFEALNTNEGLIDDNVNEFPNAS
ncbi:hypothetical protein ACVWYI_004972 [Bradyrhizobium sp. LB13.1]